MKYLIVALITLISCQREPRETMSERITGAWRGTTSPHSIYLFSDGVLDERIIAAGTEVWHNEYAYTCEGDKMRLINLVTGSKEVWTVEFPTDSTAVIQPDEYLLRIEIKRL